MRMLWPALIALFTTCSFAQYDYFATDLGHNVFQRSYIGLVNPTTEQASVRLSAFAGDGTPLGEQRRNLLPYARVEIDSATLFPSSERGWVRVDSDQMINGYVRKAGVDGSHSASPLATVSGNEVWLPQVGEVRPGLVSSFSLVNTADVSGTAFTDPVYLGEDTLRKFETPSELPGFGLPGQQIVIDYGFSLEKADTVLWDHLTSPDGLALAGTQQMMDQAGTGAAVTLTRTPFRRLVFGPMQPIAESTWNKIVLVNTNPVPLPVTITAYQDYLGNTDLTLGDPTDFELTLAPLEQRVLDIDHPTLTNLPANAAWFEVVAAEAGLLGYQLFGTEAGDILGAIETGVVPTSVSTLPYTPTTGGLQTEIAMINASDQRVFVDIHGFDDHGQIRSRIIRQVLRPGEKLTRTPEELFGPEAPNITWTRTTNSREELFVYSLVRSRFGGDALALQGIPTLARNGDLFLSDFDHFRLDTMEGQGWTPRIFSKGGEVIDGWILNWQTLYGHTVSLPGEFSIEEALDGEDGFFYFGYEPLNTDLQVADGDGTVEQVAYLSPWIEVPEWGTWYASFNMRLFNPELTTETSNYGIVWRVEGSREWQWFGMNGLRILYPDVIVGDCWAPIQFRNEVVTVTNWLPFETTLPDEVRGKRIQIGYYYEFHPDGPGDKAPWMWIDGLRIGTRPLEFALNYRVYGGGTFTVEE